MEDVQIKLSALWVALMLTYLLGDVLRIFSSDFKAGEIGGVQVSQKMWLGIAILMVIPIIMVFLSLTLPQPVNRWANIIAGVVFTAFVTLTLLGGRPPLYFMFTSTIEIACTAFIVWYAWTWPNPEGQP